MRTNQPCQTDSTNYTTLSHPSKGSPEQVILSLFLGSCVAIAPQIALAEPTGDRYLLAQQVVDGLPPPPLAPTVIEPAPLPSFDASPSTTNNSALPAETSSSNESSQRYLVYINGDSPLLLSQVQSVESRAFLQEYEGRNVIQAGVFDNEAIAEQQVEVLESQGIGARIMTVPATTYAANPVTASSTTDLSASSSSTSSGTALANSSLPSLDPLPLTAVPREIEFGQQPYFSPPPPLASPGTTAQVGNSSTLVASNRSYLVVIPGSRENLPNIRDQVLRLAFPSSGRTSGIRAREEPRGPHVVLGPMVDRAAAERWSGYLRSFGLDARVYYGQ